MSSLLPTPAFFGLRYSLARLNLFQHVFERNSGFILSLFIRKNVRSLFHKIFDRNSSEDLFQKISHRDSVVFCVKPKKFSDATVKSDRCDRFLFHVLTTTKRRRE